MSGLDWDGSAMPAALLPPTGAQRAEEGTSQASEGEEPGVATVG